MTQNILWTQIPKVFCIGPKLWPNYCNFWFLPKFGCRGNVICSLKNSGSIFEFTNPENYPTCKKCLSTLYITKICAVFTYFCPYLVVMATLFASLKILMAYVYSRTPKPYNSQLKFLDFLHRTEISATLVDVCLNTVAMVTFFGPLKFPIIYVNSLTPNTYLMLTYKISQYFIQKWNLCNLGLFLPIWLP